jgi:hypothetical protein
MLPASIQNGPGPQPPRSHWNPRPCRRKARAGGATSDLSDTRQSTTWARQSSEPRAVPSPRRQTAGTSACCLPARGQCASGHPFRSGSGSSKKCPFRTSRKPLRPAIACVAGRREFDRVLGSVEALGARQRGTLRSVRSSRRSECDHCDDSRLALLLAQAHNPCLGSCARGGKHMIGW